MTDKMAALAGHYKYLTCLQDGIKKSQLNQNLQAILLSNCQDNGHLLSSDFDYEDFCHLLGTDSCKDFSPFANS